MAEKRSKEIQQRSKVPVTQPAEQTRPGPVFTPAVDIFETKDALILTADMPGVGPQDLKVDLRESVLTLTATMEPLGAENEEELLREYDAGSYFRQFTVSDAIDQSKIEASMGDGVLHLTLPKIAAAKPRKITVKTA